MAKKTPQQRIDELNLERIKVEEKLRAKREAINQAKRREQAKILNKKRKDDTRRKILIGAMRLNEIAQMGNLAQVSEKLRLKDEMDRYLTRDSDRKLFGL